MNLRQLKYFVCIAREGSFSAAADRLAIAQSALSRHIKDLEEELGGALLDRSARGVTPNDAGRLLLDRATYILAQLQEARDEIVAHNGELTGTVRLMTPSSIAQLLFDPLVEHFHARYPKVRLELSEGLWTDALNRLRTGAVDMAVMAGGGPSDHIELEPLGHEQMVLVGGAGDPVVAGDAVDLEALVGLPLMMPATTVDILRRHAPPLADRLDVRLFVESSPAIRALVAAGRGYAVVPRSSLLGTLESRRIVGVPIRGLEALRQLGTLRGRPKSRLMQELAAAIRAEFAGFAARGLIRAA